MTNLTRREARSLGGLAVLVAASVAQAATVASHDSTHIGVGSNPPRIEDMANRNQHLAQSTAPSSAAGGSAAAVAAATIPLVQLKALVPEKIGAWHRRTLRVPMPGKLKVAGESVTAEYHHGKQIVLLTISDLGGLSGVAPLAQWSGEPVDRATDSGTEKIYRDGARTVREEFRRGDRHGEVTLSLANGVAVGAAGTGVDMAVLKQVAQGVDLARAEALSRSGK